MWDLELCESVGYIAAILMWLARCCIYVLGMILYSPGERLQSLDDAFDTHVDQSGRIATCTSSRWMRCYSVVSINALDMRQAPM